MAGYGRSTAVTCFILRTSMTKNTKLYKATSVTSTNKTVVNFRTLTLEEIGYLSDIKNIIERNRLAGELVILDKIEIPWPIVMQIGERSLELSIQPVSDSELFELTVKEYRDRVSKDPVLLGLTHLLRLFPGQSITDLFKLTHLDIIELICFCEMYGDKSIFQVKGFKSSGPQKKGMRLVNPNDSSQSLQEKMENLNGFVKNGDV